MSGLVLEMEEQLGMVSFSSLQLVDLETIRSLTRELAEIPTSSKDDDSESPIDLELLTDCLLDLQRTVKQITLESPDLSSLGTQDLDAYLKDAKEKLKLVVAANSMMYDEIKVLTRTYVEDSTRLESNLEELSCSLKFIESQAANKPEMGANVGCSTSSNASEGYNFEALALDDKIEKNKVNLSSLKDLEYILKRVEAVGQLEDSFSGLKVIEFEGKCIRLSLKTFVPTGGLFDRHKLESISDMLALDHKLLIELSDGTMELKNVKVVQLRHEGVAFRFIPEASQIKDALKEKQKDGVPEENFYGVPVVQSPSLILKIENKRYRPVFFKKEDLENSLLKASQQQNQLNPLLRQGAVQVCVLEDIVRAMKENSRSKSDDVVFVPPGYNVSTDLNP